MKLKSIIKAIGGIILATKDTVKGHCETSRCTYDVYTKEKIDEILNNVYVKDNFVVLEGIVTVKAHSAGQIKSFSYPTGFTKNNTVIISKQAGDPEGEFPFLADGQSHLGITTEDIEFINQNGSISFGLQDKIVVWLNTSEIEITVNDDRMENDYDYNWEYKVVLMKYKD